MAASVVQSVNIGGLWAASFAANCAPGNTLLLFGASFSSNGTTSLASPQYNGASVTGASQVYSVLSPGGGSAMYSTCWLLPNISGVSKSVSLAASGTANAPATSDALVGVEISGLGPATAAAGVVTASAANGNLSIGPSGTGAIVFAQAAIFGSFADGGPGAPWTSISGSAHHGIVSYQVAAGGLTWAENGNGSPWAGGIFAVSVGNLMMASFP